MKGILFKSDMIQAMIDERKTQTRRLGGLKEINEDPDRWIRVKPIDKRLLLNSPYKSLWQFSDKDKVFKLAEPRYNIGEMVYIKEAWRMVATDDGINDFAIVYPDGELKFWRDNGKTINYPIDERRHSPLMMPAKYARYFITITDVKPQRIATITRKEISAEGTPHNVTGKSYYRNDGYQRLEDFRLLWDSINKKNPFEKNEWVWAYTFKRCE